MWKKGEIVWVNLTHSDTWIPGRILNLSEPLGALVSFFGLMEPRYVPRPGLRSFERDFEILISDSGSFRRLVNRALRAHFWNISFGLCCSCQTPIDSPNFDRENSLPWFPPTSESALGFVRDMAVSVRVPLRKLAEINNSTAQILSFRRYSVDFKRSVSVYEDIRESVKLMDHSDWCLDSSNKLDCIDPNKDLSLREPLAKDIPCCSSESEHPIDKVVQVCTWNTRNFCETMAHDGIPSEPAIKDITEDDIIGSDGRTVTSAKYLLPLVNASNNKFFLAKPVSFVFPETLACSVKETYANRRSKSDSHMTNNEELLEKITFNGKRENCYDSVWGSQSQNVEVGHITGTSNRELSCDDVVGIAPAERLQDLDGENQTRAVDNVRSIGAKRKARRDKANANSKRVKKAGQQSVSTDKPHLFKDIRIAEPKCLRMKFLSRHGNLPSKAELLKRFSVFGKIDPSKTDVNPERSSAKVVFLQSIDAVTAYQFGRSKKFTLGRCKVMYQLDPFEGNSVVNKEKTTQKVVPSPKSCLKENGSVDKENRRKRKVRFQMEIKS